MITNKDINEEILGIEKQIEAKVIKDAFQIATLKLQSLTLKMLMSMRTNQTLTMDKLGVKRIEPQVRKTDETEKK